MKEILLTQNQVAIVDDEDFLDLNSYKWFAHWNAITKSFYAERNVLLGSRRVPLSMHRQLLGCEHGDGIIVDHANQKTLDNRRENLRTCSKSQNSANSKVRKSNLCGYKGVSYRKDVGKFIARIMHFGTKTYLGRFDSAEEAYEVYLRELTKLHPDFAA